jgi:hypothetical protein
MHCSTILLTALSLRLVGSATTQGANCDCGYYDPSTQRLFTDFLIVHFKHKNICVPKTPSPLLFKLWSNGDPNFSEGPPKNTSTASVGWTRSFFNASTMSHEQHQEFDSGCSINAACSMDDMSLRGHTQFNQSAIEKWKPPKHEDKVRTFVYIIFSCSVGLTVFLLGNVTFQRWPKKESKKPAEHRTFTCSRLPPHIIRSGASSESQSVRLSPSGRNSWLDYEDDTEIKKIGVVPRASSGKFTQDEKDYMSHSTRDISFRNSICC